MSTAARLPPPLPAPVEALARIGITHEVLNRLAAQGLSVEDAVARGALVIELDPRLKVERLGTYLAHLAQIEAAEEPWNGKLERAEQDLDPENTITLPEAVALGLISADDMRLIEGRATRKEIEQLKQLGYAPEELAELLVVDG
jgi:hypothetical protein